MSLSTASNTINALGIFGRLDPEQELYFKKLSDLYSHFPPNEESKGIFNHLTLALEKDAAVSRISPYLDALKALKTYLPIRLNVTDVFVKDDQHIALRFDPKQTEQIRILAATLLPTSVVITDYTKVVWFVPAEHQATVIAELQRVKEMMFYDFKLVANRQDDEHTIYSSLSF